MKKNIFWIVIVVLFLALSGLYAVFVSSARDKLSTEEKQKKDAIKRLDDCVKRANAGDLVSDAKKISIKENVVQLQKRVLEVESFLKDIQKDFIYVKGLKDWVYDAESILGYKSWYNKKKDDLYASLLQSGFVFESEGNKEATAAEADKNKEKIGFRSWGSDSPLEKDIVEAQQQLALMTVIIDAINPIFKTQKNVFPSFQKVTFGSWMQPDPVINVLRSHATLKIDCPFSFVNQLMCALEKTKIHLKVDSIEIAKKANAMDYSEFPNVALTLGLSFQIFNDKKVK